MDSDDHRHAISKYVARGLLLIFILLAGASVAPLVSSSPSLLVIAHPDKLMDILGKAGAEPFKCWSSAALVNAQRPGTALNLYDEGALLVLPGALELKSQNSRPCIAPQIDL
jgi:hypothetical protein